MHDYTDLIMSMHELGGNGFLENLFYIVSDQHKPKTPKITNCKNCGAVLHGNKCEFCDTKYDW